MTLELLRWVYMLKSVWAVLIALAIGALLILTTGHSPIAAYRELFGGAFFDYWGLSATLVKLCPLLLAGLAVALPLRVGLFNIGAEGQIYMGGLFATIVALYGPELPGLLGILLCAAGGLAGGAVWAAIPALLKAYRDLNEVIVTLLLNYVAINIVSYAVSGPLMAEGAPYPYSEEIRESLWLPYIMPRTDAHAGVIVAVIAALLLSVVMRYTSVGYSLQTVGANPQAARYAGMSVRRHIMTSMLVGGALAGLAGAFEVMGLKHRLFHLFSAGYGYDGIVIAFLAGTNALGTIVAATFMAGLESGANMMQRAAGVPVTLVEALKGLIVIFVATGLAFSFQRSRWARLIERRRTMSAAIKAAQGG
ncbi:ABC transporter permease [Rhodoligotrophos defluvii]|uniref:ABC transporter permease n=1 Tax=Rhodoligotrophos defluvii TaxID=2561934 RepID=UPI00196053BE|nr:ABC transporter permease [Rhodoligotrophos defluvii]